MQATIRWILGITVVTLAMAHAPARAAEKGRAPASDLVAKGRYVFATAGGCACHTPPGTPGLNAGGMAFHGPFGEVYSRNITPDRATGVGRWTDAQIAKAIRHGERPDGTRLFPVHPYIYLANLADDETAALVAYLKSVKPVSHRVPPRKLKGPAPAIPVPASPKTAPLDGVARGEYLVKGASHCGDCHTPRRPDGSQDPAKFLAGGPGPEGSLPSNITPHPTTGIGRWTEDKIARLITTGERPKAGPVGSLMRVVIQGSSVGYKDMTPADALAIAQYLKTVPPVENRVP
jgi:mono/diheme cytochrome c family protein